MSEQDTQVIQPEAPAQEEAEVNFETMSDEALEQAVNGQPEAEPEEPNGSDDAPAEGEKQAPPPTVEELQAQLEEAKKGAEQLKSERDHWQKVRTEQEQNANAIRAAKEELQKRLAANRAKDPAQLFIDNPQAMMDAAAERARLEMQLEQTGQAEQNMARQAQMNQNALHIQSFAPDLSEHMDGIAEMLVKYGDTPETINAFRQNPAMFPADKVQTVYSLFKAEKARIDLEKQLEEYKTRGSQQLQKVEQAAQRKPMTNAATGAQATGEGSFPENMSREDISQLSDSDLDAILAAAQK